jgi:adenylate kinase family enzyme
VVGTSAVGKSTLAAVLSRRLGVPHVELDALFWEPGWTRAETTVLRERVARATAGDAWVVDGNYSMARDLFWSRVQLVVWLDYSLPRILWYLTRRTLGRLLRRQVLWNGNRERWRTTFLSRDSLYWWVLTTYRRRRRELADLQGEQVTVVRLRSPGQTRAWLAGAQRSE